MTRCGSSKVQDLVELVFNCTQSLSFAVKYRLCSRHLCTRQMESEGGFGALILVYAILMQRVSTTTRARIVKWLTEIVAIEKPVKATARSPVPACVPSQRVRFHAGWTRVLFRASVSYASEGAYVNFMTEEEGDRVAPLTVPTMIATHRSKEYDPDNVPFKPEHQIIA